MTRRLTLTEFKARYDTPEKAWAVFVGNQTPDDFVWAGDPVKWRDDLVEYVYGVETDTGEPVAPPSPLCADLSDDERDVIFLLLERCIIDDLDGSAIAEAVAEADRMSGGGEP